MQERHTKALSDLIRGLTGMWTCRICDHPMREMIDQALVQGDPTDDIRRRFFVMMDDLRLHDAAHRQPANVD
jgi:hypothetical protein